MASLVAVALWLLAAFPATAGDDDRIAAERKRGTPMGAVGMVLRLDADGALAGTGFLVSPCHIMTAAHVVAGNGGISADQVLLFFAGTGRLGPADLGADYFGARSPARPVVWGDYQPTAEGDEAARPAASRKDSWNDWALLKLDRCLGDDGFGHFDLLPIATRDFTRSIGRRAVTAAGHPADRGNRDLTMDPSCTLLGQVQEAGWQHDCTTLPGNSGGPVLAARPEAGEEWPRVLAITVSSVSRARNADEILRPQIIDPADPSYLDLLATAVPVSAFLPRIAPYLPKDPRIDTYLARHGDAPDTGYDAQVPETAIEDLTAALRRQPGDASLLLRRGKWYEAAKDEAKALDDFSAALAASPNSAAALQARAMLRAARDDKMLGDAKAAMADIDRLIQRFPDHVNLRIARAGLLASAYDYEAATEEYDRVLQAEPDNIVALLSRASAGAELGRFADAAADYDAAIAAEPDLAFIYVQRAHFNARRGDLAAAFADVDRALEIEQDMPAAISARAVFYLHAGGAELALAEVDRALALDPESGPTTALRGTIRQILGDLDGAIADFRKAGELDPKEPFDPLLLFLVLSEAGRTDEARQELETLLGRWPADEWPGPLARHFLGRLSATALQQRVDRGNDTARNYQAFDRHFYLGMAAYIEGDQATARAHLAAAVALDLSQFLEFDLARAYLERLGGAAFLKQTN